MFLHCAKSTGVECVVCWWITERPCGEGGKSKVVCWWTSYSKPHTLHSYAELHHAARKVIYKWKVKLSFAELAANVSFTWRTDKGHFLVQTQWQFQNLKFRVWSPKSGQSSMPSRLDCLAGIAENFTNTLQGSGGCTMVRTVDSQASKPVIWHTNRNAAILNFSNFRIFRKAFLMCKHIALQPPGFARILFYTQNSCKFPMRTSGNGAECTCREQQVAPQVSFLVLCVQLAFANQLLGGWYSSDDGRALKLSG